MKDRSGLNPHAKEWLLADILVCSAALILGLIVLSVITRTDIFLCTRDFWQTRLEPNKNTIEVQTGSGINTLAVYYWALLFSAVGTFLIKAASRKSIFIWEFFLHRFKIQTMLILTALVVSQTTGHVQYFRDEIGKYYHKSIQQKIGYNFDKSYAFAQYCKRNLPGKHFCQPITGMDLDPQKNLLTYLAVRYYLYPLDIVTNPDYSQADCKIIFLDNNPKAHVSPPFRECPAFDAQSLIAIKEGIGQ